MVKRLIDRKHSKVIAERVIAAHDPLRHLTREELDAACEAYKLKQQALAAAPDHIKMARRFGTMSGAKLGYNDEDIAKWIDADELARRELDHPEDFVFNRSDSAARSDTRRNQSNVKGQIVDDAEIVRWIENKFGPYRQLAYREAAIRSAMDHFQYEVGEQIVNIGRSKVMLALKKAGLTGPLKK